MSITSEEVNYLVYRYLQESGFTHTAFAFSHESLITNTPIDGSNVPPGALITYLQKGLQYVEIETHLMQDGTEIECNAPFSLTQPHTCSTTNVSETNPDREQANGMDLTGDTDGLTAIPLEDVHVLTGHSHEVFVCAWNPMHETLASGSGDGTARIWATPPSEQPPIVLKHYDSKEGVDKTKGVTTLDWCPNGELIATGSYDGQAHIWTADGVMKCALNEHSGPVFSLKWNAVGDLLLSCSADKTAIIWDANTGFVKQKFTFHKAPTLDVDWKNQDTFASCSTDNFIFVCKLGESQPLKVMEGHKDEVNAIKWDPSGTLLASCSDDLTVKVWNMQQPSYIHSFAGHDRDIFTIRWGPATRPAGTPLLLASASLDSSIKVWNVDNGTCIYSLAKHSDPVYSVAFSPDGLYLASGSCGTVNDALERGDLQIWRLSDGELVRSHKGSGGIFEVCWNPSGSKVAACFSNTTLAVINFTPPEPPL